MAIPTATISEADRNLLLGRLSAAAKEAGHPWPDYAACEAAAETGWMTSGSSRPPINNLFGCKAHWHPDHQSVNLPTREFLDAHWVTIQADFEVFPSWQASFDDRIATLRRLAPAYPHYRAALSATDGETFVREVSQSWSTDPNRADTVLAIHRVHFAAQPAAQVTT